MYPPLSAAQDVRKMGPLSHAGHAGMPNLAWQLIASLPLAGDRPRNALFTCFALTSLHTAGLHGAFNRACPSPRG